MALLVIPVLKRWSRARGPYGYLRTWNWPITARRNQPAIYLCKIILENKSKLIKLYYYYKAKILRAFWLVPWVVWISHNAHESGFPTIPTGLDFPQCPRVWISHNAHRSGFPAMRTGLDFPQSPRVWISRNAHGSGFPTMPIGLDFRQCVRVWTSRNAHGLYGL